MSRNPAMSRPLDELGRICVPKEMREALQWDRGTVLDIEAVGGGLRITRNAETCACCRRRDDEVRLMRHRGIAICEDCFSKFEPVGVRHG